jgi:TolA-binding protein
MKKAMIIILTIVLSASLSFAGEENSGWWNNMKNKLDRIAPKKKTMATTAVGGVRGAQDDETDALYWKGREEPLTIDEEELEAFNNAVEEAIEGNNGESLKLFEEFMTKYPDSILKENAEEATERLKAEDTGTATATEPAGSEIESEQ